MNLLSLTAVELEKKLTAHELRKQQELLLTRSVQKKRISTALSP